MIRLTEEQTEELAEKFFKHNYYDVEDDVIFIDGHVIVSTIPAAADWIREETEKQLKELKSEED